MSPAQSRIQPERYTDPAAFAAECREIFRRTWVYLGLKAEFGAEPKPVEIGGGAVMVARDGAAITLRDGARAGRVETLGELVFGCFDPAIPPLATRFAPYAEGLRAIGDRLHGIEHREVIPVAANWKLVI